MTVSSPLQPTMVPVSDCGFSVLNTSVPRASCGSVTERSPAILKSTYQPSSLLQSTALDVDVRTACPCVHRVAGALLGHDASVCTCCTNLLLSRGLVSVAVPSGSLMPYMLCLLVSFRSPWPRYWPVPTITRGNPLTVDTEGLAVMGCRLVVAVALTGPSYSVISSVASRPGAPMSGTAVLPFT